jgi:hypothetical protein
MMRSIPFEHVKDVNEKRYNELMDFMPSIQAFNIFMMAKEIGVTFSPTDLDIEQVNIFSTMHEELKNQQKTRENNGR